MRVGQFIRRIGAQELMDLEQLQRQKLLHQIGLSSSLYKYENKPVLFKRMKDALLIQPHHLPQLSYLCLSEMWYILPLSEDITVKLSENQVRDIAIFGLHEHEEVGIHDYFSEVLNNVNHRLPSKFIRSYLAFYRKAELKKHDFFHTITFFNVLSHLQRFRHNDSDLLKEFLTTVCSTQKMQRLILNIHIRVELVKYILKMCNRARFDLRRFLISNNPRNHVSDVVPFCPVLDCLFGGKIFFLKMLLQHGFETCEFDIVSRFAMYKEYLPEMNELVRLRLPENGFKDKSFRRKLLILDTFCLVIERSFHWINHPVDWTECANLLFRSIPDPYITMRELQQLMDYSNSSKIFASSIRFTFLNSFAEIKAAQYKPRALQHLCRCTIRKTLRNNFQLPEGIYKLSMPRKLCRYLLLEN